MGLVFCVIDPIPLTCIILPLIVISNEIKVLLMANVHGGNLHHIYADTEILSARLLIILSMARYRLTIACLNLLDIAEVRARGHNWCPLGTGP
jgi:hypothetical protein